MRIQNIATQNFNGNKISILNDGKNKEVKFLYNKVRDIVDEFRPTTTFKNDAITMNSDSNMQTKQIMKALKEKEIDYTVNDKSPLDFLTEIIKH